MYRLSMVISSKTRVLGFVIPSVVARGICCAAAARKPKAHFLYVSQPVLRINNESGSRNEVGEPFRLVFNSVVTSGLCTSAVLRNKSL